MDPGLKAHLEACRVDDCPCRTYAKNVEAWSAQLPIHPAHPEMSWLWFKIVKDDAGQAVLTWCCMACGSSSSVSSGQYHDDEAHRSRMQIANLKRHHNSPAHNRAVGAVFGLDTSEQVKSAQTVPTLQLLKELIVAFQKGGTCTSGFRLLSGFVSFEKAKTLLWCVEEGVKEIRLEVVNSAECMCIMRDERHHRMHLRYRLGRIGKPPVSGFLGQSRDHKPDDELEKIRIQAAGGKIYRTQTFAKAA